LLFVDDNDDDDDDGNERVGKVDGGDVSGVLLDPIYETSS
jgi:hypothetical protein